jgi:hypothetical protein
VIDNNIFIGGSAGKVPLAVDNTSGFVVNNLDITTDYFGNVIDTKRVMPGPFHKISEGFNKFFACPNRK